MSLLDVTVIYNKYILNEPTGYVFYYEEMFSKPTFSLRPLFGTCSTLFTPKNVACVHNPAATFATARELEKQTSCI